MNRRRQPPMKAMTEKFDGTTNVLYTDVLIGEARKIKNERRNPVGAKPFRGVWDTGASRTVISENVVRKLNLSSIDKSETLTANGPRTANVYLVNVYLKNGVAFPGLSVIDGQLVNLDFLIGMDIIGAGDFAITQSKGQTCVSYQIPHGQSPIDFVKILQPHR